MCPLDQFTSNLYPAPSMPASTLPPAAWGGMGLSKPSFGVRAVLDTYALVQRVPALQRQFREMLPVQIERVSGVLDQMYEIADRSISGSEEHSRVLLDYLRLVHAKLPGTLSADIEYSPKRPVPETMLGAAGRRQVAPLYEAQPAIKAWVDKVGKELANCLLDSTLLAADDVRVTTLLLCALAFPCIFPVNKTRCEFEPVTPSQRGQINPLAEATKAVSCSLMGFVLSYLDRQLPKEAQRNLRVYLEDETKIKPEPLLEPALTAREDYRAAYRDLQTLRHLPDLSTRFEKILADSNSLGGVGRIRLEFPPGDLSLLVPLQDGSDSPWVVHVRMDVVRRTSFVGLHHGSVNGSYQFISAVGRDMLQRNCLGCEVDSSGAIFAGYLRHLEYERGLDRNRALCMVMKALLLLEKDPQLGLLKDQLSKVGQQVLILQDGGVFVLCPAEKVEAAKKLELGRLLPQRDTRRVLKSVGLSLLNEDQSFTGFCLREPKPQAAAARCVVPNASALAASFGRRRFSEKIRLALGEKAVFPAASCEVAYAQIADGQVTLFVANGRDRVWYLAHSVEDATDIEYKFSPNNRLKFSGQGCAINERGEVRLVNPLPGDADALVAGAARTNLIGLCGEFAARLRHDQRNHYEHLLNSSDLFSRVIFVDTPAGQSVFVNREISPQGANPLGANDTLEYLKLALEPLPVQALTPDESRQVLAALGNYKPQKWVGVKVRQS